MPKQITLKITQKELELLEQALESIGNDMLAEAEDSPKQNWFYTPSKRKSYSSLVKKFNKLMEEN